MKIQVQMPKFKVQMESKTQMLDLLILNFDIDLRFGF